MKTVMSVGLLIFFVLLTLSSCVASGRASYGAEIEISPIQVTNTETGIQEVVCCEVSANLSVENGKDIETVDFGAQKMADGSYKVWLKERGVDASTPAGVAAESVDGVTQSAGDAFTEALRAFSLKSLVP